MSILLDQLRAEALPYDIEVEEVQGGVELLAPEGTQFDAELHGLVNTQWDHEPMPNVFRRAIADLRNYGPMLRICPTDCPCRE